MVVDVEDVDDEEFVVVGYLSEVRGRRQYDSKDDEIIQFRDVYPMKLFSYAVLDFRMPSSSCLPRFRVATKYFRVVPPLRPFDISLQLYFRQY